MAITTGAALIGGAVIGAGASYLSASKASEGIEGAAETSAAAQGQALDYLKEVEAAPSYYREEALGQLAGFYGIPGYESAGTYTPDQQEKMQRLDEMKAAAGISDAFEGTGFSGLAGAVNPEIERLQAEVDAFVPSGGGPAQGGQQQIIESVMASPFYESMRKTGAESVGRYASATGGLRSGNAVSAFAESDQNVLQRLVGQRIQGLSGMASLPSYASEIAGVTSGIGATQGAGILAAAQAQQQGYQGVGSAITGGINNYLRYNQPPPDSGYRTENPFTPLI